MAKPGQNATTAETTKDDGTRYKIVNPTTGQPVYSGSEGVPLHDAKRLATGLVEPSNIVLVENGALGKVVLTVS